MDDSNIIAQQHRMQTDVAQKMSIMSMSPQLKINMTALTPEALLIYCNAQLQGLDRELKKQLNEQKTLLDVRANFDDAFTMYANRTSGIMEKEMQQALESMNRGLSLLPANHPLQNEWDKNLKVSITRSAVGVNEFGIKAKIKEAIDKNEPIDSKILRSSICPIDYQGDKWNDQVNSGKEGIQKMCNLLKSSVEIAMTELQQIASKRQTVVQLITAILNKCQNTQEEQARKG